MCRLGGYLLHWPRSQASHGSPWSEQAIRRESRCCVCQPRSSECSRPRTPFVMVTSGLNKRFADDEGVVRVARALSSSAGPAPQVSVRVCRLCVPTLGWPRTRASLDPSWSEQAIRRRCRCCVRRLRSPELCWPRTLTSHGSIWSEQAIRRWSRCCVSQLRSPELGWPRTSFLDTCVSTVRPCAWLAPCPSKPTPRLV